MNKKNILTPQELQQISNKTLSHYEQQAAQFWEGTKDHDVFQNYQALLHGLSKETSLHILDFGCGPGRDLLYFKGLGHQVIGLEGCAQFCEMAKKHAQCEVWQQNFLTLNLPLEFFDGIFANASLFHVPSQELSRVLKELWFTLKPNGILFSSNPRGNYEGWQSGRYANFLELEIYQNYLEEAGFKVCNHYYRPSGKPCHEQPWLAVVSRKIV